eukprot:2769452-Pleurochrysis_carterae.AAC.1
MEVPVLKNGQAAPRSVRLPDEGKKEGLSRPRPRLESEVTLPSLFVRLDVKQCTTWADYISIVFEKQIAGYVSV